MNHGLKSVEALLQFGLHHQLMENEDVVQVRNQLYTLLRYGPEDVDESLFNHLRDDIPETATAILTAITDDYAARGHMPEDTITARDLLEAAIMGQLIPRQSEMTARFGRLYADAPEKATDDFFALSKAANYILVDRIKKDMYWTADTEYGMVELTVNLSKPEKDPKDIAAALLQPAATYPKCLLCLENVGFAGTRAWPARQNLRVIPLTLDSSQWYFQYSPYAYYNEHCIVLSAHHNPMEISKATFQQLAAFVKQFPHYFLGSNADLPIVGGSILSHEHFQGGRHVFPMEKAESFRSYAHEKYPDVKISLVKWPLSVIRISAPLSGAAEGVTELASDILDAWRGYSEGDVAAYTDGVPHNTITPIARVKEGRLEMDLVLRNNRTSDEHPMGIFHPHEQWHHIKKENIGLIEVMGLAVLPGRLKNEIEAGKLDKAEIAKVFVHVLQDCGVFKDSVDGHKRFDLFMKHMGMS
ncbi:MAG: UDP-glucose--hexose-1-phosphate uridylyltransferase [Defluviitaleaceae bacterium]|nr:UDP-glucose--hexose-1-phosphate uridylyltransferase [Defluviitaleaceae bacterium]